MKNLDLFIIERLKINKDTKIDSKIKFDAFINLMKTSKNNKFTYIDSIKNINYIQIYNWYKWDVFEDTYVYVIKKITDFYKAIVIQKNQNNPDYITIVIVNVSENIKNDNTLYYFDCFFDNSNTYVVIKNIEWVNEFLNLLELLTKNPDTYNDNIRWSNDFRKFEKNFNNNEYLEFKK